MHVNVTPLYGYTRRLPATGVRFHPDYDIVGLATYQRPVNQPITPPSRFSRYNSIFQQDTGAIDLTIVGMNEIPLYANKGIPLAWLKQFYRFLADHYQVKVTREFYQNGAGCAVVRLAITTEEFEEFYQWKRQRQF